MKLHVLKLALKLDQKLPTAYTAYFFFESAGAMLSSENTVCLSRNKPGGCNFTLQNLHEHISHSPFFPFEQECEEYAERIISDVHKAVEKSGYNSEEIEVEVESKIVMPPSIISLN